MAVLDRAHPFIIEWLCSAEWAATTRAAFGEDANKVEGDRRPRNAEALSERPLGAPREQGHAALSEKANDLDPTEFGAELSHRVVVATTARRVDRVVRSTRAMLHTDVASTPFTLIPARVEVATDTYGARRRVAARLRSLDEGLVRPTGELEQTPQESSIHGPYARLKCVVVSKSASMPS